jgi:hypothetical protein
VRVGHRRKGTTGPMRFIGLTHKSAQPSKQARATQLHDLYRRWFDNKLGEGWQSRRPTPGLMRVETILRRLRMCSSQWIVISLLLSLAKARQKSTFSESMTKSICTMGFIKSDNVQDDPLNTHAPARRRVSDPQSSMNTETGIAAGVAVLSPCPRAAPIK